MDKINEIITTQNEIILIILIILNFIIYFNDNAKYFYRVYIIVVLFYVFGFEVKMEIDNNINGFESLINTFAQILNLILKFISIGFIFKVDLLFKNPAYAEHELGKFLKDLFTMISFFSVYNIILIILSGIYSLNINVINYQHLHIVVLSWITVGLCLIIKILINKNK